YWHWTVADLDAAVTSLPEGAGADDGSLPGNAFHARSDGGSLAYEGAGPHPGDRPHRYIFAVHALDVESRGVSAEDSPTQVAFLTRFHTIARGTLTATFAQERHPLGRQCPAQAFHGAAGAPPLGGFRVPGGVGEPGWSPQRVEVLPHG